MSIVIVDETSEPEETTDAVVEVVEEVAEAVADAVADAVAETSDSGDMDTGIVIGVTMAEVAQLRERVDALEARVTVVEETASSALTTAVDASVITELVAEEVAEEDAEEVAEEVPQDEPPTTKRTKFNDWFFGKG